MMYKELQKLSLWMAPYVGHVMWMPVHTHHIIIPLNKYEKGKPKDNIAGEDVNCKWYSHYGNEHGGLLQT